MYVWNFLVFSFINFSFFFFKSHSILIWKTFHPLKLFWLICDYLTASIHNFLHDLSHSKRTASDSQLWNAFRFNFNINFINLIFQRNLRTFYRRCHQKSSMTFKFQSFQQRNQLRCQYKKPISPKSPKYSWKEVKTILESSILFPWQHLFLHKINMHHRPV